MDKSKFAAKKMSLATSCRTSLKRTPAQLLSCGELPLDYFLDPAIERVAPISFRIFTNLCNSAWFDLQIPYTPHLLRPYFLPGTILAAFGNRYFFETR